MAENKVESKADKLERLRAWRAQQEAIAVDHDNDLEIAELELAQKYTEMGQKRGVDFDVCVCDKGAIVVKRPDYVVAKKYMATDDKTIEDTVHFVRACVGEESKKLFEDLIQSHSGVAWACAVAALKMNAATRVVTRGK